MRRMEWDSKVREAQGGREAAVVSGQLGEGAHWAAAFSGGHAPVAVLWP